MAGKHPAPPVGYHKYDDGIASRLLVGVKQEENIHSPYILRLPLHCVVCGATGTGKTFATLQCIVLPKNSPFHFVVWCGPAHSNEQPALATAKKEMDSRAEEIGYDEGMIMVDVGDTIDEERVNAIVDDANANGFKTLVVFDDLAKSSKQVRDFMTKIFTHGRHRNCHAVELRQTIFDGQRARDNRMQASCYILTDFPQRDTVLQLLKQIEPLNSANVLAKYERCIEKPNGFLLIDRTSREPKWRYRDSCLLPKSWDEK